MRHPTRPFTRRGAIGRATFTLAVAIASVLGVVSSAAASNPTTATGTFTAGNDVLTPILTADGNSFYAESLTGSYSGDLQGPFQDTDTFLAFKNGSFRAHGTEVCTGCTIGSSSPGDFTAVFTYSGAPTATGLQFSGHLTVISASGGLAGLHLGGTFQGNETPIGTYSYNYALG
jgi:hypothetical protein